MMGTYTYVLLITFILGIGLSYRNPLILQNIIYGCAILNLILYGLLFFELSGIPSIEYRHWSLFRNNSWFWADCAIWIFLLLGIPYGYLYRQEVVTIFMDGYNLSDGTERILLKGFEIFFFMFSILFVFYALTYMEIIDCKQTMGVQDAYCMKISKHYPFAPPLSP